MTFEERNRNVVGVEGVGTVKAPLHERFTANLTTAAAVAGVAAGPEGPPRLPMAATRSPPVLHSPKFTVTTSHRGRFRHSQKTTLNEVLEGVDEQAWYATYGSTTALLTLAHVFFLRQYVWGAGKHLQSRQQQSRQHPRQNARPRQHQSTLASYHTVVRRKRFHLLLGAVFSHQPNPRTTTSTTTSARRSGASSTQTQLDPLDVPAGHHSEDQTTTTASEPLSLLQSPTLSALQRYLQTHGQVVLNGAAMGTNTSILRGLPLLFYCAHCLWACRALEVLYHGSDYARVLWTLTWTACIMDLALSHMALTVVRDMNFATSTPFVMGGALWTSIGDRNNRNTTSSIASRVERTLTHRTMGGLTATTAAVLFLFQHHFDAPIPILPFVSTNGPVLGTPVVSWIVVIAILLRLSQSTHPVMGVACGTISGLFWTSGWTFWLAEPYWCYGGLSLFLGMWLLSLKIHTQIYFPCIEYAPWNAKGDLVLGRESVQGETAMDMNQENADNSSHTPASSDGGSDDEDNEDTMELGAITRQEPPQRRRSSSSINHITETSLLDIDPERDTEQIPLLPAASASMTMRSRRPPSNVRT